jgi:hypothetical protein
MAERDRGVLAAQQEADAARTTMANVARVHDGTHAEANELVERAFSDLRHAERRFNRVQEKLRRRRWVGLRWVWFAGTHALFTLIPHPSATPPPLPYTTFTRTDHTRT